MVLRQEQVKRQLVWGKAAQGFTLAELLVVVTMVGILGAIAVPGWLAFQDRQRLNVARQDALNAMRESQIKAIRYRRKWQTSFRELDGRTQWSTHPVGEDPNNANWHNLPRGVQLDDETSLLKAQGVRRVQFNHHGHVNGQLGRLTLSTERGGEAKRCIVVSTLLGALRSSEEQSRKERGRSCW